MDDFGTHFRKPPILPFEACSGNHTQYGKDRGQRCRSHWLTHLGRSIWREQITIGTMGKTNVFCRFCLKPSELFSVFFLRNHTFLLWGMKTLVSFTCIPCNREIKNLKFGQSTWEMGTYLLQTLGMKTHEQLVSLPFPDHCSAPNSLWKVWPHGSRARSSPGLLQLDDFLTKDMEMCLGDILGQYMSNGEHAIFYFIWFGCTWNHIPNGTKSTKPSIMFWYVLDSSDIG